MRYAKQKSTGKLLEAQGGGDPDNAAHLETLLNNAKNTGIAENDIEVGYEEDAVVLGWLNDANEAAKTYVEKRKSEYPSISEQLDDIYHNGIDAWKATIKVTKDKYPKG